MLFGFPLLRSGRVLVVQPKVATTRNFDHIEISSSGTTGKSISFLQKLFLSKTVFWLRKDMS
ncbi:MAG: hypothetical protein A3J67_05695 [Parcubacteria group bacterium RIFCSPHIGHO2_02_FULL_48_10b]|nr:MAG: hypothetical protein A3J67_05695 [Parcubacteria group bacterium RIFCSPHIGHO2_02_FULL_48_10b]